MPLTKVSHLRDPPLAAAKRLISTPAHSAVAKLPFPEDCVMKHLVYNVPVYFDDEDCAGSCVERGQAFSQHPHQRLGTRSNVAVTIVSVA